MPNSPSDIFFVGIDVGTGSVRAALFDAGGRMHGSASTAIQLWRPEADFVEQSSTDIWAKCCDTVRGAIQQAGVSADAVRGLGFDATCSLVALDPEGKPVSVSPSHDDEQNVIVWMDHRAVEQAERINRFGHEALSYVGGTISPEMESPKILWLKENLPTAWKRTAHFFDLPDFLTFRATGDTGRSLCSLVCKWTYLGHKRNGNDRAGWSDSYWRGIGLEELVTEGYRRIGTRVRAMGEPIGDGLSSEAAKEFGLRPGTAVGASIIDAHAGGLGVLGVTNEGQTLNAPILESRLAIIAGTSSCLMAVSKEPRFIPGCWGPYYSAMVPGYWLTEGGQSATGALIDHVIYSHTAFLGAKQQADKEGQTIFEFLNRRLSVLREQRGLANVAELTADLHLYPDFHGNRSPRANPNLRGMISGLKLSAGIDDLALQYLATIQAIAYQVRHIIEEMNSKGYQIETMFACGGGLKNEIFLSEHADITGCSLVLPREPEAVLLGSAILGAVASGVYPTVLEAMRAMSGTGRTITPRQGNVRSYHERKYRVYHRMYDDQVAYRALMEERQLD
jgi:D-ribulokinase